MIKLDLYHTPTQPKLTSKKNPGKISVQLVLDQGETNCLATKFDIYRSAFEFPEDYSFLGSATLAKGIYEDLTVKNGLSYFYYAVTKDTYANSSGRSNICLVDFTPPRILIDNPKDLKILTNQSVLVFEGSAIDKESGLETLLINDTKLVFNNEGSFQQNLSLTDGFHEVTIKAIDKQNNLSETIINIQVDTTPPLINVTFPQDNTELFAIATNARGSVSDQGSGLQSFRINQQEVSVNADGTFLIPIPVVSGKNTYLFEAIDKVGNTSQKTITVKGVEHIVVQLTIGSLMINVNGKDAIIDAPPFIHVESKRTMVPVRFVVEPIGGNITFDATEQKVTILREENQIELWVNRNTALMNGKQVPIDVVPSLTPMIVSGRTFLPLRFVSENIGFKVDWDPRKYMVRLEFPDPNKKRIFSYDVMEAE